MLRKRVEWVHEDFFFPNIGEKGEKKKDTENKAYLLYENKIKWNKIK